jgi:hypothetical protein
MQTTTLHCATYIPFKIKVSEEDERAFWDITLHSLVRVDRRFRGVYCLHHQGVTDDGGSTHL